jgi:hypothetical protein
MQGPGAIALALAFAFVSPAWAARDASMKACRPDFSKLCSGVKPGGGRIAECLKLHEAELAPACKAALDKIGDCGQEVRKICGAASGQGQGAVRECVKTHASEFSATCRAGQ